LSDRFLNGQAPQYQNTVEVHCDPERIRKLLEVQSEQLDWRGIKFPVEVKNIHERRFEKQNKDTAASVISQK